GSFRRGETEYGVKAIPLGGYVRIAGMNPLQETPAAELPRTYGAKPPWQRFLVVLAGPITHFVMAFVVLALYFLAVGTPKYAPEVGTVERTLKTPGGATVVSPAWRAHVRPGDLVAAVGRIERPDQDTFIAYTHAHVGKPVVLTVVRHGRTLRVTVRPVLST